MRLINSDDVKELLIGLDSLPWEEEVDDLVDRLPTVEAKPVVYGEWIPFTQRKMTEEEKQELDTDLEYILDCKLPDNDTEILVCSKFGHVFLDTFINDCDGCYLDSGYEFIEDAVAWMPLPTPYNAGKKVE
jgi:hypothetical protein